MPENLWLFRDREFWTDWGTFRYPGPLLYCPSLCSWPWHFCRHSFKRGRFSYSGLTSEFCKYSGIVDGSRSNTKDRGNLQLSVRMDLYQSHLLQCFPASCQDITMTPAVHISGEHDASTQIAEAVALNHRPAIWSPDRWVSDDGISWWPYIVAGVEGRDDVALTSNKNNEFSLLYLEKRYNPISVKGLHSYRWLSWSSHPSSHHRIRQMSSQVTVVSPDSSVDLSDGSP